MGLRILHIIGTLHGGGAQNMIMNIYRNIDRSKIQFDFVAHMTRKNDFSDEIKQLGGRIYYAPRFKGINIIEYKNWWNKFFDEHSEYSIIHAHMTSTTYLYVDSAHKHGITVIAHSHSGSQRGNFIERAYKTALTKSLKSKADYLFACSELAGINKFGERGIHQKNYYMIKNAIDAEKYVFDDGIRRDVRAELKSEDNLLFGHIGTFSEPKNHMYLLEVFSEIHKRNNNARLVMAGDGILRPQIEEKIKELGIEQCTALIGYRKDINKLLMALDLLLFPSFFEGLSVTVIEAQATGLRCLVSDRLSQEHKITELVEFESIDEAPEVWAEKALAMADGYKRENRITDIIENGYSIKDTTKWISDFYESISSQQVNT